MNQKPAPSAPSRALTLGAIDSEASEPTEVSGVALWQWRASAQQQAIAAAISVAEVDWLLQILAGVEPLTLKLGPPPTLRLHCSLEQLDQLWQKRVGDRIPVQYLAGVAPWRNFLLKVSPAVLIPRPETELLIDLAVKAAHGTPLATGPWADLGTGSGAIALGLAEALPLAQIHAVDCSPEALAIARENAAALGWSDRLQFHQGSWFEPLAHLGIRFSGIVSNPPYIPTAELAALQPEVLQHEPHLALDGGPDGLNSVRQLIADAPQYLQPGGIVLLELMVGQAEAVAALMRQQGDYEEVAIAADLAGIERFIVGRRV